MRASQKGARRESACGAMCGGGDGSIVCASSRTGSSVLLAGSAIVGCTRMDKETRVTDETHKDQSSRRSAGVWEARERGRGVLEIEDLSRVSE